MSENYLQSNQRGKLEVIREEANAVAEIIRTNEQHIKHEKRHPGRMERLEREADKYLQEAEYLLPAMADGPTQKVAWIGFRNSLTLAREYLIRAVIDPDVMTGERTRPGRQKGGAATSEMKRGAHAHADAIRRLAAERDELGYSPASELWPHLYSMLPNANEAEADKRIEYEGGEITYENFRKTLRRIRESWDTAKR